MENKEEVIKAITLLIQEGYLLGFKNNTVLEVTGKMNRLYESVLSSVKPLEAVLQQPIDKISLRQFKEKAEIPFQIKTNAGTKFTASAISKEAERYFNKNIAGKVNMETLILATKAYYADTTNFRQTLTNYITQDIWKDVLKNYKDSPQQQVANPTYKGQRSV